MPASLLANWASEIERFAPSLKALVAHPSAMPAAELQDARRRERLADVDLVITSYGSLLRMPVARRDPVAARGPRRGAGDQESRRQADARRQSSSTRSARIALTGTPVENRLGDLWSLFDFLNPGLLGSGKEFSALRQAARASGRTIAYAPLRELVRPYILRRLKTDKTVIADLPDKTEVKAFCALSRAQAALYQQAVTELADAAGADAEGIERRGVVLAFLMRFKQICNHPSQWLGDGAWAEADSGKFARLREIAEVIAAQAGEGAGLHAVPRDDRAAGRVPRVGVRPARAGAARRTAGEEAPGAGASGFRRTRRCRSSCSRSRPAAPGST